MTRDEWESLCDGCGQCCLIKVEDEDTANVYLTRLGCRMLDTHTCRCRDYPNRKKRVRDCTSITAEEIPNLFWLPATCAYRRLAEGRGLALVASAGFRRSRDGACGRRVGARLGAQREGRQGQRHGPLHHRRGAAEPRARPEPAMPPPLLQLSDIALTFGGHPLLDGVELSVSAGERVCLVGRNGSGKSTLLKIAAGLIEPDRGERFVQPGASVRYLPQEPDFAGHATTLSYVEAGLGASDDAHQARYLLQQLGLNGDEDPARLSGGEARRAALARVLAPQPDILLLDEPTNHLDMPTIEWLEGDAGGAARRARAHQP